MLSSLSFLISSFSSSLSRPSVDIRDRERVLAHYLDKIGALVDGLYDAVQQDTPLRISEILAARDASSH